MIWRIIPLIVGAVVLTVYFNFQSIRLNMLNWGVDQTVAMNEIIPQNRSLTATRSPEKPLTFTEQALDISGELAFSPDRFVRNRIVTIERQVTIEDLLLEGEDPPQEAYEPLYVDARAAMTLVDECTHVVARMARECVVAKAGARKLGGIVYRLTATLRYLPDYDMGAPVDQGGEIATGSLDLTPDTAPPDDPAARIAYFDQALGICGALKERFGNCFIQRIGFSLRSETGARLVSSKVGPSKEGTFLHAIAQFSVHGPWAAVNQQILDAAIADFGEKDR